MGKSQRQPFSSKLFILVGKRLKCNFIKSRHLGLKRVQLQELDAINKLISDGKLKANEIRNNLKNLETTSTR